MLFSPGPKYHKGYCRVGSMKAFEREWGIMKLRPHRRAGPGFPSPAHPALFFRSLKKKAAALGRPYRKKRKTTKTGPHTLLVDFGLTPPRGAATAATHSEFSGAAHLPGND